MSTHVDVYIDYVCPFCFLVEPALEELKRERDVVVQIHPFELRPAPVPTLRPEDEYLPRVWNDSVYPMAERMGVEVRLPTISPQPRTEKAFMVLQLAREQGRAEEYSKAMLKAFFQDDLDIGSDSVVVDVGSSVGLDPAEVESALHDEERRARQQADQRHAVDTVGIRAVPGILVEGQLVHDVPSAARLKKVVDDLTGNGQQAGR